MCADRRSLSQPGLPQSHGSSRPFCSPHDSICLTAHSPAAFRLGEPVGPRPVQVGQDLKRSSESESGSSPPAESSSRSRDRCAPARRWTRPRLTANEDDDEQRSFMSDLLSCRPRLELRRMNAELALEPLDVDVVANPLEPLEHQREVFAVLADFRDRNLHERDRSRPTLCSAPRPSPASSARRRQCRSRGGSTSLRR